MRRLRELLAKMAKPKVHHTLSRMTKKRGDSVIPKKYRKEVKSEDGSHTESFEDGDISSEEHKQVSSLIN